MEFEAMKTSTLVAVAAAILLAALAGTVDLPSDTPTEQPAAGTAPGAPTGTVTVLPDDTDPRPHSGLDTLTVRPEDTTAPYDRDQWGDWTTHGHGCDTRELVLTQQGHGTTAGDNCRPVCPSSGPACWASPYDAAQLREPRTVHIDHRVPLAEAHRSGAADWTAAQRERFYNDPTNLVAASASSNTSKGDNDPGDWRPTNRAVWCDYATAYVTTKDTYGLSVDPAERDALAAMLGTCPGGAR